MSGLCAVVMLDGAPLGGEELDQMTARAPHRSRARVEDWRSTRAALAYQDGGARSGARGGGGLIMREHFVVAAHARLDNFDQLHPFLVRRGYLATDVGTTSTAELILAAHAYWGTRAAAHLIGDFAYVVWDRRRRSLLAARDPMGLRPLYYRIEAGRRAIVASELKQILAVRGVRREIDERSIAAVMAGPHLPRGATAYVGVAELVPGDVVVMDEIEKRTTRPWRPRLMQPEHQSHVEIVESFRARLETAVADRLRPSDATGLLLSGGHDSGAIAVLAGNLYRRGRLSAPPTAFTWAFADESNRDERAVSDRVTSLAGLTSVAVDAGDGSSLAAYPGDGPDEDDPFVWPHEPVVRSTVAAASRAGVDLVLTGHRGDELVGDWIFDDVGLILTSPIVGFRELARAMRANSPAPWTVLRHDVIRPRLRHALPLVTTAWHARRGRRVPPPWIPEAFARRAGLEELLHAPSVRFDGYARSQRYARIFSRHSARLTTVAERTWARAGIEYAEPFADRRLVELVVSLPQRHVQRRERPKMILREAIADLLPGSSLGVGKHQLSRGEERELRARELSAARALLKDSLAARNGWLDADTVLRHYERYVITGQVAGELWWPISVEMWLRRWWS